MIIITKDLEGLKTHIRIRNVNGNHDIEECVTSFIQDINSSPELELVSFSHCIV